jgi:putative addiction module component (TIGR02574 family)
MARAEDHVRELLKLPVAERAEVAQVLLDSIDEEEDDDEAESLRLAELVRRANAVRGDAASVIDADEARRRIAARLRALRGP